MVNARTHLKRSAIVTGAVLGVMVSGLTQAGTHYERARVVDVQPLYKTVSYTVPVEQCHEERVAYHQPYHRRASATGPILGAIIGGAVGNAVGHSSTNKKVGTVVGAVLGGSIGADVARHQRRQYHSEEVRYRTEEVCRVSSEVREEERADGYRVSYVFGGETYTTRMNRDPGDSIRVRVRVSPAE